MSAQDEETGQVTEVPEGLQLRIRRSWPDPVADVWSALTGPDRLARWIGTYQGERRPGGTGTFTMTHEAEPAADTLRIVECDPPHRLVVEWENELSWRVELDLAGEDGGTVLLFTQLFPPGTPVADYALGWRWYLEKLAAEVTGGPAVPDWDTFSARAGTA